MTLVDDLVVQVEQSIDSVIPMHDLGYQLMIKFASPVTELAAHVVEEE